MDSGGPIRLLFGNMEKLGPGSDSQTREVLRLLPNRHFAVVVDAGCGTGRQTLVLAAELETVIEAVDSHQPFLEELTARAHKAGLGQRVRTHCIDMRDIPAAFPQISLLWSEGAAYNIGFSKALEIWAQALEAGGLLVVSELSWLRRQVPKAVREFFRSAYPDMSSVAQNVSRAERAGYHLLATHTLPAEDWVEGYYEVLEPRARRLAQHPDPSVRELAAETLWEIEIFGRSEESYGYVFYILQLSSSQKKTGSSIRDSS